MVLADIPFQCHVEFEDSTCGVTDWGVGSHFQKKGELEGVL